MMYDIEVFRSFFGSVAKQLPGLTKLVDEGLSVLIVLHECLISLAGDSSTSTLEELIMVLHRRTGANVGVTKSMMKDLALLIACRPDHRRKLKATLEGIEGDLHLLSKNMDQIQREQRQPQPRDQLSGLRLKDVLEQLYDNRILPEQVRAFGPCMNLVRKVVGDKQWENRFNTLRVPASPRQSAGTQPFVSPVFTDISFVPDGDETTVSASSLRQSTDTPPVVTPPSKDIVWIPGVVKAEKAVVFPNFNFTDGPTEQPTKVIRPLDFSQEEHEQTVKALQTKLFATLKLHNLRFVAKRSSIDFEKRLAEINERILLSLCWTLVLSNRVINFRSASSSMLLNFVPALKQWRGRMTS